MFIYKDIILLRSVSELHDIITILLVKSCLRYLIYKQKCFCVLLSYFGQHSINITSKIIFIVVKTNIIQTNMLLKKHLSVIRFRDTIFSIR